MKKGDANDAKEIYKQFRVLSCSQLWEVEVPRYDKLDGRGRVANVGLIRALGVVFAASGTDEQKREVKTWLRHLLEDPEEKVRRYAMAALPKLGSGIEEEAALLSVLKNSGNEREKKFLGRTLDKIGGEATLELIESGSSLGSQTEQKVKASVARTQRPTEIRTNVSYAGTEKLRIHLRCRKGLEQILRGEVEASIQKGAPFRFLDVNGGIVAVTPTGPFSLSQLYAFRCFATLSFVLGSAKKTDPNTQVEEWASLIASPLSRNLLETFSEGSIRYRLSFEDKGAQRGAVRDVVNRAYELCPAILNDAREAPWAIDIHPRGQGATSVELRPRISPDPRLSYRVDDVPAASHPPLAACLARLAMASSNEIVWDPFCGSGLELIERALLGGVRKLYGTDLDEEAIAITAKNVEAAKLDGIETSLTCCDFRNFSGIHGLTAQSITLVISNPPLGRRVRITGLRELFYDLFEVSSTVLKKDGLLVFVNPFKMESPQPSLKLQSRQTVDLGGFNCHLEVYRKQ